MIRQYGLCSSGGKSVDGAPRVATHPPVDPCAGVHVDPVRTKT